MSFVTSNLTLVSSNLAIGSVRSATISTGEGGKSVKLAYPVSRSSQTYAQPLTQ